MTQQRALGYGAVIVGCILIPVVRYRQNGHLSEIDIISLVITLVVGLSIVALVSRLSK